MKTTDIEAGKLYADDTKVVYRTTAIKGDNVTWTIMSFGGRKPRGRTVGDKGSWSLKAFAQRMTAAVAEPAPTTDDRTPYERDILIGERRVSVTVQPLEVGFDVIVPVRAGNATRYGDTEEIALGEARKALEAADREFATDALTLECGLGFDIDGVDHEATQRDFASGRFTITSDEYPQLSVEGTETDDQDVALERLRTLVADHIAATELDQSAILEVITRDVDVRDTRIAVAIARRESGRFEYSAEAFPDLAHEARDLDVGLAFFTGRINMAMELRDATTVDGKTARIEHGKGAPKQTTFIRLDPVELAAQLAGAEDDIAKKKLAAKPFVDAVKDAEKLRDSIIDQLVVAGHQAQPDPTPAEAAAA